MLNEMSLEKFAAAVASREPVPGGGSVSALAGALAAALSAMVAELTIKKEQYADRAPLMRELELKAERLQGDLLAAVDGDADSYRGVLAAFRRPKSTDEEKRQRAEAVQAAFRHATEVPLQVARCALDVLELAETAVRQGNPDMVTDAAVGALMARSGALGALMNAEFNLKSLKDRQLAAELSASIAQMKQAVLSKEAEVFALMGL